MSEIAEAASIVLARAPDSQEVFLVARAPTLRFFGSFHAFPGGRIHAQDHNLAQSSNTSGLLPQQVAAARELFEETGVLLARREDGSFPVAAELSSWRQDLLQDRRTFAEVLEHLRARLLPQDLIPAGSLVTPAFSPVRFDTTFLVTTLPPGQEPTIWPGELTDGTWLTAEAALAGWTAGELLLSPPTVSLLEILRGQPVAALPGRLPPLLEILTTGVLPPIWFSPGVFLLPLRCDGLPPASHINTWLVGSGPRYLLDPGATDPEEQGRLFEAIERWVSPAGAAQRRVDGIVLTHHHPDHVGAVHACVERYQVPVLAHPLTARLLQGQVAVDRFLEEGDHLDLGPAPGRLRGDADVAEAETQPDRWALQALHTPGHAPGHLAFFEPTYRLLFAGDLVSTLSSVIIAPPEGDLAAYLDSLRRLQALPTRLLMPAHGPVSARPAFVLERALEHRALREQQLLTALGPQPRSLAELAREIYQGLPHELRSLAEQQTLAGLHKLAAECRAQAVTGGWVRGN